MNTKALELLSQVKDLPTLPTVYTALADVMANPRSTISDAAALISADQASAAKVLSTANSAIYGYSGKVDTISKAIFFIGFNEIRNIIAALSIMNMFGTTADHHYFRPVDFWRYSLGVGVITRHIGMEIGAESVENFFLAGILHDIGKLMLYSNLREEFLAALDLAVRDKISLAAAETRLLGITHHEVGEILGENWKIPPGIVQAIRYHHRGMTGDHHDTLTAAVHVASTAARLFQFGHSAEYATVPRINPAVWNTLKLRSNFFTQSLSSIEKDYHSLVQTMLHRNS
jgi:HD-like signal output (HDOD) protein